MFKNLFLFLHVQERKGGSSATKGTENLEAGGKAEANGRLFKEEGRESLRDGQRVERRRTRHQKQDEGGDQGEPQPKEEAV